MATFKTRARTLDMLGRQQITGIAHRLRHATAKAVAGDGDRPIAPTIRRRRGTAHLPATAVRQRPAERQDLVRLFLPLVEPKRGQVQLMVRAKGEYRRRGVAWDASGWRGHAFNPSPDAGAVLAQKESHQSDSHLRMHVAIGTSGSAN